MEHFTCSVCTTLFGPQDSYYEHENDVYCHYHYSTRFATKCVGCNSAILKQFVEINRNSRDECWHPECYMIHKVCGYVPKSDDNASYECKLELIETSLSFSFGTSKSSRDRLQWRMPPWKENHSMLQKRRPKRTSLSRTNSKRWSRKCIGYGHIYPHLKNRPQHVFPNFYGMSARPTT